MSKKLSALFVGVLAAALLALPVQAQFSRSYNFLEAIKKRDGTKVTEFVEEPGSGAVIINTRDVTSGETALHLLIADKDLEWTTFLLQKGANPNIEDKKGETPLMLATRRNFVEGVEQLIKYKADINARNRSGETALIRAVQLNNSRITKILLAKGGDADIADYSGYSARDYAERDPRKRPLLSLIETNDEKKAKSGESSGEEGELDFSGIGDAI